MKEEIRHCQVCGGAPKVKYSNGYTWVVCKRCGLESPKIPDYVEEKDPIAREQAIASWNEMEANTDV